MRVCPLTLTLNFSQGVLFSLAMGLLGDFSQNLHASRVNIVAALAERGT